MAPAENSAGPRPASPPGDDSVELSSEEALGLILNWIENRTPAAAVRFLEGEGRLLMAEPEGQPARMAIRKLRRQTGLIFSPGEMLKVKALVTRALEEADLVGIRADESFDDEHLEWIDRIARRFDEMASTGRKPAYVTDCLFSTELFRNLPRLLAASRRVSVVSCRDVAPILRSEHGVDDVAVHQIPSQYTVRAVDEEYEASLHDVPIWPDFYRGLERRIAVREEGEVFLVGAGLFGKALCLQIRDLGGIALDMGSTLDRLVGKTTRGRGRPAPQPMPTSPRTV